MELLAETNSSLLFLCSLYFTYDTSVFTILISFLHKNNWKTKNLFIKDGVMSPIGFVCLVFSSEAGPRSNMTAKVSA